VSPGAHGSRPALLLVGISRETAPVRVRELASLGEPAAARVLREIRDAGIAREALALCTCNRTEVYAVAADADRAATAIRRLLARHSAISEPELALLGDVKLEGDAAEHLFSVVAGLRSSILGEVEIVAQARAAVALARREQTLGPLLDGLTRRAFAASRRVRAETGISRGALSLASVAVGVAEAEVGEIVGRRVLVVGAGAIAQGVTRRLAAAGAGEISVANRSRDRARGLAQECGAVAVGLDALADALAGVDLVVAATAAPRHVLTRALLGARRGQAPLVVIDLAVPRDVEPSARTLPGVRVYDIDHVQGVAAAHLEERRRELPRASSIVRAEIGRYEAWRHAFAAAPVIDELRRAAEEVRLRELDHALAGAEPLSDAERHRLDAVTRSLVTRLLHEPTRRLRDAGATDAGREQLKLVRDLLGIAAAGDPAEPAEGAGPHRRGERREPVEVDVPAPGRPVVAPAA
jgi:glutamyl-tRNA reductase